MLKVVVKGDKHDISRVQLFAHESFLYPPFLEEWMQAYQKKEHLPLSLRLDHLPPFTQKVLQALQTLPFGKRITYGALAEAIGYPKAARAVGNACGQNPYPLLIPCHRVVHSKHIGGYTGDLEVKRRLLQFESL